MTGQKSGLEFATQQKTHNLVLISDLSLFLSLSLPCFPTITTWTFPTVRFMKCTDNWKL